jgi:hypothetical protein
MNKQKSQPTLKRDTTTYPSVKYLHVEHSTGDTMKFPEWHTPEEKVAIKNKCTSSIQNTVKRCKKLNP